MISLILNFYFKFLSKFYCKYVIILIAYFKVNFSFNLFVKLILEWIETNKVGQSKSSRTPITITYKFQVIRTIKIVFLKM